MHKELNHAGRYLFALRMKEGSKTISDYLKKYKLPISDNYYRDVESGRKQLSLEKAIALTKFLPLDADARDEFIWFYLRDVLPENIGERILLPRVDKSFASAKEAMELLHRDLHVYRKADAMKQFEEHFISEEHVYSLLADNMDLLPILHFIYMTDVATEGQVRKICENENILFDLDSIIEILAQCGVTISKGKDDTYTFVRAKPVFRVTNTVNGKRLKRIFADVELAKSRQKPIATEAFDLTEGSFETTAMISVSRIRAETLRERLQDFLAETALAKDLLKDNDAQPFFVMCVVSSRPEYNP